MIISTCLSFAQPKCQYSSIDVYFINNNLFNNVVFLVENRLLLDRAMNQFALFFYNCRCGFILKNFSPSPDATLILICLLQLEDESWSSIVANGLKGFQVSYMSLLQIHLKSANCNTMRFDILGLILSKCSNLDCEEWWKIGESG